MVDPANPPTVPEASNRDLQEFLMFSIAVAGKNANVTATALDNFLRMVSHPSAWPPLERIYHQTTHSIDSDDVVEHELAQLARQAGMGCYTQRAKSFMQLANAVYGMQRLNIRKCNAETLEEIYGIGKKTSRFFIVYSRPWMDNEYAILDTHILSWMREVGCIAPFSTPSGKQYDELEKQFIQEATSRGVTAKELDKSIWISRRVE
jgi:thermostable 8-oxoguanine DNA glycosylase